MDELKPPGIVRHNVIQRASACGVMLSKLDTHIPYRISSHIDNDASNAPRLARVSLCSCFVGG
jgi:hypothetical protein